MPSVMGGVGEPWEGVKEGGVMWGVAQSSLVIHEPYGIRESMHISDVMKKM